MTRPLVTLCAAVAAALALTAPALAQPAAGLNPDGNQLLLYGTSAPGTITERHAITGLQANEKIMGLDVRPASGALYGLGVVRGATDSARIYVIDPGTGAATALGEPFRNDLPPGEYGFDVNPATDVIRVVNRAEANVRVNATTGALVSSDSNLAPGGDIDGIAYDQNVAGSPQTTLWAYDSGTDKIGRIGGVNGGPPEGSPNSGMVVFPFVGGSGIGSAGRAELDFSAGGAGFLTAQTAGPAYGLYSLNMSSGTVTLVGNFPEPVEDLALLAPSSVEILETAPEVGEGDGEAAITVTRSGNTSGTQTVAYATADDSATGADYTATSGSISFGPGEATKVFTVPITDDDAVEQDETLKLNLSAPTGGAALGARSSVTLTILDDDEPADRARPRMLLLVPASLKLGRVARGLKGKFSCSEDCVTRLTLKLRRRTIGKAKATLFDAGVKSFKVKLSSKGKKALRKYLKAHSSARLSLTARGKDASGNVGTARARVRVTR